MVQIQKFTFNPFQENTYVLFEPGGAAVIIDPGCYFSEERDALRSFLHEHRLTPVRLINTHCHLDHVFGNAFVHREWGLKPEYHPLEKENLARGTLSAQLYGIPGYEESPTAESHLSEGDEVRIGEAVFEVLFTPGHAPGHVALYCESQQTLVAGDVIFREGIGRTDLPGGDHQELFRTIREKVFTLPEATVIHSGHGPETTVGHELTDNPFFQ